jgi:hypothetical protein
MKEGKGELISRKHIHYSITKGPQFALEVKQLETDLTVEMLASYVPLSPSSPILRQWYICGPRHQLNTCPSRSVKDQSSRSTQS